MKNGSLIRCVRLSEVRLSNIDCISTIQLLNKPRLYMYSLKKVNKIMNNLNVIFKDVFTNQPGQMN